MPTTHHQSLTLAAILTTMVAPIATQSEPGAHIGAKATVLADYLLLAKLARQPEAGLADLPDHRTVGDPFAIARLLRSSQPHVRARAAILLRQKLSLPLPDSTLAAANAAAILQHEVTPARPSSRLLTMALAQQAIDQLAPHTLISPVLSTDPSQLTSSQRQLIAAQLIQHSSDTPLERASTTVIACLQTAMHIDPAACLDILGLVIDTPCKTTRTRALIALQRECRRRVRLRLEPLPDACAALALTLLESPSAEASLTAALLLEHVLQQGSDPVVLAAIHRRANDRIRRDIEALQLTHPQHYGCTGGTSLPPVDDQGTQLVLTSARLGNRELIQPVLDQLREFPGRCDAHTTFLLQSLYWLAPLSKPEQAARMFQPLAPHVRSRPTELGRRTLFRLYATVHPDLLPLLDKWHTGEASDAFWFGVASVAEHLSLERIERLLDIKPSFLATVVSLEPERIRKAWLAGNRAEATAMLTSAWRAAPKRMLPFVKTLPIPLVANSTIARGHASYPLELLLHLHAGLHVDNWLMDGPALADHHVERTRMYAGLARNLPSVSMQPEELPQLAPFAADADHPLAIAAATRAYWLSENGRDWCRDVLAKICACESVAARIAALKEAVRLGVRPDNWRTTATDLLESGASPEARLIATAALVRLGEQPVEVPEDARRQVLALVMAQADCKTLRQLVHTTADFALLQYQTSASTTIATMQLAMDFPDWSRQLEHRVLQATTDPFPSVRRAAYATLATRDRGESAGAWLALEASLDSNESVRSVVPAK